MPEQAQSLPSEHPTLDLHQDTSHHLGAAHPMEKDNLSPPPDSAAASTAVQSLAPSDVEEEPKIPMSPASSRSRSSLEHVPTVDEKTDDAAEKTITQQRRDAEAAANYPTGYRLGGIVLALSLCVLCVALDNTIIATAIPHITDEFHALNDVGWYGSAYLLTTAAFQLFFGRLYTNFSIKWTFLVALGLFELGSLLCGVAPNSTALILGRAIAGLGCSGIFSGALIILSRSAPLEKRPIYTAVISGMYGIASVVGPLLGGAFTDHATWRWCFYINLPLGGITALLIVFLLDSLKQDQPEAATWRESIARFDPLGTVLFMPAIVCLLLALQWGGTTYAWSDGRIIALFVVFGLLIIAFVADQFWVGDNATIPIRIMKQRSIASGAWFSLFVGAAFFLVIYYLPFWFQALRGDSATESGIHNLPMLLANIVAVMVAGGLVTTLGYYTPLMYFSVVVGSIGAGLLTLFTPDTSIGEWIGFQIVFGLGVGAGLQQSMMAAQTVLSVVDVPIGTSIIVFAQTFGGALFVSVGQNTFTNQLVDGLAGIPGINAMKVVNAGATEVGKLVTDPQQLAQVLVAYNGALVKVFQVALITMCLSVFGAAGMEWKSVKGKKVEMAAA